jgi:ketosteroid isomerase-like protein
MPQEKNDVVRQTLAVRPNKRRRLEERVFLRFPGAASLFVRTLFRFRPRSRVRRVMVRRAFRLAFEAANRGDYEAALALYPSDGETITPPELVGLGFEPVYRGREERLRFQRAWVAELGDFQQEAGEAIDLGDRVLLLARMKGSGLSSGAMFENEIAYLLTFSAGRFVREETFRSHQLALEAAGLRE